MDDESHSVLLSPHGVTWLGMGVNTIMAVSKVLAGVIFSSQIILADGLHAASDLITDLAVLAGLKVSDKPADPCHPYGHRRVATMVAMFVGAALLAAGGGIVYKSLTSMRDASEGGSPIIPLILAAVSIPVKEGLYQITRLVGRRSGNPSLLANAWHHRSDAFSSIAATAGLAAVAIGGKNWAILDPITAMILAAFLVVAAVKIIREAAAELIDRAPAATTLEAIERAVAGTEGVQSHHAFRARKVGGKIAMDIHVQVDGNLSVSQGHEIACEVRRQVNQADKDVIETIVHVEPVEEH